MIDPQRPCTNAIRIASLAATAWLAAISSCGAPRARIASTPRARESIVALPADPDAALARVATMARASFRRDAAMQIVRVADRGFRARGNAAYVATLEAVQAHLASAGFVANAQRTRDPVTDTTPWARAMWHETLGSDVGIWDARAGLIEIVSPASERLHAFDAANDRERTMLVAYTHPGDVRGEVVELHENVRPAPDALRGRIVLTELGIENAARVAVAGGAIAILSAETETFNRVEAHPDTIRYEMFDGEAPPGIPMFNISPRSAARLRTQLRRGAVTVHARSDCTLRRGLAETLVARITGRRPEAGPVVLVAHADEPGANDNASGVGTLAEVAATYARLVAEGRLPPPDRTVLFLFGMEIEMSRRWLEFHPQPPPAFALSVDMAGEAPETSPILVERTPDPGALRVRPPDAHTSWGAGSVRRAWVHGSFLNALVMAGLRVVEPGWGLGNHPFEGGSDHVPFLSRGVPSLLVWHFPDDAYHSNRDRLDRVSDVEMSREGAALVTVLATGLAGDRDAVLTLVGLNERWARERLAVEFEASRTFIVRANAPPVGRAAMVERERQHVAAWARWFDEAISSCGTMSLTPDDSVARAIEQARARVRQIAERGLQAIGAP